MLSLLTDNISTFNFILIDIALGLSIYLTLSTGLLSLANAGFMGIGAYTAAVVATRTNLPLASAFILAPILSALLALPLGLLVLRLRDVYLAIATIGFGQILSIFALNGDKPLRAISGDSTLTVFNGAEGITLAYATPAVVLGLPVTTWPLVLYVLALAYLLATLQGSRFGRILASIRIDETAAATSACVCSATSCWPSPAAPRSPPAPETQRSNRPSYRSTWLRLQSRRRYPGLCGPRRHDTLVRTDCRRFASRLAT